MDIAASLYEILCTPIAGFLDPDDFLTDDYAESEGHSFQTDPASVGSEDLTKCLWSIDGCTAGGTQLFTVPNFLSRQIPLRIDLLIPDQRQHAQQIRCTFRSSSLCYTQSKLVEFHPVVAHVLKGLEHWTRKHDNITSAIENLPFGSRIILMEIGPNSESMQFLLSPEYDLERNMLSLDTLKATWRTCNLPEPYPPTLDLADLEVERHVQDSITFVRIRKDPDRTILVLKSSNSGFHYLYNELRTLIQISSHDNIISKPKYIVTKRCCFGSKIGVCGFILPYYPLGSLRDNIPRLRDEGILPLFRLAEQICSALLHLQEEVGIYHSDLRPDNIVLSKTGDSVEAIVIDFEQRGNWYTWSPPEIFFLEYCQEIIKSDSVSDEQKARYSTLLRRLNCEVDPLSESRRYRNCEHGCSEAWNCLSNRQKESATVYLFGKLLWCLFEGVSTVSNFDTIWHSGPDDGAREFPEFVRTPLLIQELVLQCTKGAPEHEGRFSAVVRNEDSIVLRTWLKDSAPGSACGRDVLEESKLWWQTEVERAEAFLRTSDSPTHAGPEPGWIGPFVARPSLREVFEALKYLKSCLKII